MHREKKKQFCVTLVQKQLHGLNDWRCSCGNKQETLALCPLHKHSQLHAWVLPPPVRHHHRLLCLLCGREEVGSAVFCAHLSAVSAFYVSYVLQSCMIQPLHMVGDIHINQALMRSALP